MGIEKNKIVVIVGAGAVENAWAPILNAIKNVTSQEVDIDGANCLFARFIYLLRFYSKIPHPEANTCLKISIENMAILKDGICEEIIKAQKAGVLKPRKEFSQIVKKFIFNNSQNNVGLISTNWDTVIDSDIDNLLKQIYSGNRSIRCFHIHGNVGYSNHLYLPSETTQENYRSDGENKKFGLNHFRTMQFLEQANQILIYGLSLDPLDAELSQLLNGASLVNNNLREIIIVNPDYERIRNRIKVLLFPKTDIDIKIKCFLPQNLEQEV